MLKFSLNKSSLFLSMLLPLGALASGLDTHEALISPPYKKKAVFALVGKHTLRSLRHIDPTPYYVTTVYFTPNAQDLIHPSNDFIPAPVSGVAPTLLLKRDGWVGSVQWREMRSEGAVNVSPDIFKDGVAYAAQIQWTLESRINNLLTNVLQMPSGAYREGSYAEIELTTPIRKQGAALSNAPDPQKPEVSVAVPANTSISNSAKVAGATPDGLPHAPALTSSSGVSIKPLSALAIANQSPLPVVGQPSTPQKPVPAPIGNSAEVTLVSHDVVRSYVTPASQNSTIALGQGQGNRPIILRDLGVEAAVGMPVAQTLEKPLSTVNSSALTPIQSAPAPHGYASLARNAEVSQPNPGNRPIVLPDLGNEADASAVAPLKKPYNPDQQSSFNSPARGPPGSPMSAPSLGAPNAVGGSAMGNNNLLPGMTPAPMQKGVPIPALNVGDAGAGASIAPTATDIRFEAKNYLGHVGLSYLTPGSTYGLGVKADGAYLLSKTLAIGTNLSVNNNLKEAVLSGVWMPEDTHLKTKLSGSYMTGAQSFGFYSGTSNANVSQASYYFSTDYVVPKEQSSYLHSVGVSTWGSKARQTNNPDPVYSVVNTASAYQIMMDPLRLAVGTLQGESINTQVGITKQVIAKVSAGYESVKFPFSDGTQEVDKRIYQDYVVQYQPTEKIVLQTGYKAGAAINNIMISAAYSQWKLTGFKNNGVNGVASSQGAMLAYSIPLDGNTKAVAFGTLIRPELIGNSSYILRDAATRPIQLPQTFLAKVDTTAVKTVASISKVNLPAGVTVNAAGDAIVTVGVGGGAITGVTRNGAPYAYASTFQMAGSNLAIRTKIFPVAASSGDAYIVSVTDKNSIPYLVTVSIQN